MEPPTASFIPNIEKIKEEKKYVVNSNKNNEFNIVIKNLTSFIEINASNYNNKTKNEYINKYSLYDLKENKYLSICDTIDDIYEELLFEFSNNKSIILENENHIIIQIPVSHAKYKEISFSLNKKIKTDKELYNDLNELVYNLKSQIEEKTREISLCNKEIKDLKILVSSTIEKNKQLENKIDTLEKELSILKNDKLSSNNSNQTTEDTNLEKLFEEIENPWTDVKEKFLNEFDYILKNNDYYAERKQSSIKYIKSKYQFEANNIYRLIYNITWNSGQFRIGFGDFGACSNRLKEKGSIGLTDKGLYVEGKEVSSDIKLTKDNKEIMFVINLKEKKYFELYIDGKSFGKYDFNLEVNYGLAAINNGSISIKTLKNL